MRRLQIIMTIEMGLWAGILALKNVHNSCGVLAVSLVDIRPHVKNNVKK